MKNQTDGPSDIARLGTVPHGDALLACWRHRAPATVARHSLYQRNAIGWPPRYRNVPTWLPTITSSPNRSAAFPAGPDERLADRRVGRSARCASDEAACFVHARHRRNPQPSLRREPGERDRDWFDILILEPKNSERTQPAADHALPSVVRLYSSRAATDTGLIKWPMRSTRWSAFRANQVPPKVANLVLFYLTGGSCAPEGRACQ